MNSTKINYFVVVALSLLLVTNLSSCAKKPVATVDQESQPKVEDSSSTATDDSKAQPVEEGMGSAESLDTEVVAVSEEETLEGRTSGGLFPLYFDFDKSTIRSDQVERVEDNAMFMKNNPDVRVRIEGNCDERGTNEYNMALGQRRALSGQKYLINLGIDKSRIDTISYGEEQPINFGHDELSWSHNRRDDFIIIKQS